MLSDRYITDRFLPDKAIDLVDESASRLRMEIDSSPVELDEADRRVRQLEIELAAMANEAESVREPLERELADAKAVRDELAARWSREKESLQRVADIKRQIDELRMEAEREERAGNLARVAEIQYGVLPELEKELAEREERTETPMVKEEVDEDDIAAVVSSWTGIPVSRLLEGEVEKLIHMEERLHQRVVGQDGRSRRSRTRCGARAPGSRIPTGRSARSSSSARPASGRPSSRARSPSSCSTTSARWCGSTCRSTRSGTRSSRLVGAPPGYVGYEEGGQLTEAVRRRPYTVVLLDEIEKAHTEVFDVLLQLLDDGRLTDGQGRTVDFRNTVIIMTSNIRSQNELRDRFRPEFLNRVDEVVSFEALTREQLADIVDLQLRVCASGSPSGGSSSRSRMRRRSFSPRRAGIRRTARGR